MFLGVAVSAPTSNFSALTSYATGGFSTYTASSFADNTFLGETNPSTATPPISFPMPPLSSLGISNLVPPPLPGNQQQQYHVPLQPQSYPAYNHQQQHNLGEQSNAN